MVAAAIATIATDVPTLGSQYIDGPLFTMSSDLLRLKQMRHSGEALPTSWLSLPLVAKRVAFVAENVPLEAEFASFG